MRFSILVFLLSRLAITVAAQTNTAGFTPAAITPGTPNGAYMLSGFESINLSNQYVNFRFPLATVGGRGKATTF